MSEQITWADNTTQDRFEEQAEEHGWTIVESTSDKTVLRRFENTLTLHFGTEVWGGQYRTRILRYELSVSWAPPGLHESVVGTIIEHGSARA